MVNGTKDSSPKKITELFILLITLQPVIYFIVLVISLGRSSIILLKPMVLFYPLVALFCTVFFINKNRYLQKIIDYILSGNEVKPDELGEPVKKYPVESMIVLFSGCMAAPLIAVLSGVKSGIIISPQQGIFLFMLGTVTAFIAGILFFYAIKVLIHRYIITVGVKPLSPRYKLSIPLLAVFLGIIVPVYAAIYRSSEVQSAGILNSKISSVVKIVSMQAGRFFSDAKVELEAYSRTDVVQSMDFVRIKPFLITLAESGSSRNVEIYFACKISGKCLQSTGGTVDISGEDYFKTLVREKRAVFSEPLESSISGKEVIVCMVPVYKNGILNGAFGAVLPVDIIYSLLSSEKITDTGRFMIISQEGKFLFHAADRSLVGKVLGRDIKDDGVSVIESGLLLSEPAGRFFRYTFYGGKTVSYKTVIPSYGHYLVFSTDTKDYTKSLNKLMIFMLAVMVLSSAVIFSVIFVFAGKFSGQMNNAAEIFFGLEVMMTETLQLTERALSGMKDITETAISDFTGQGRDKENVEAAAKDLARITELMKRIEEFVQKAADAKKIQPGISEQLVAGIKKVIDIADHASGSIHEEMISGDEIYKIMTRIKIQTREIAASADEIIAAAGNIKSKSADLKDKLSFFMS